MIFNTVVSGGGSSEDIVQVIVSNELRNTFLATYVSIDTKNLTQANIASGEILTLSVVRGGFIVIEDKNHRDDFAIITNDNYVRVDNYGFVFHVSEDLNEVSFIFA